MMQFTVIERCDKETEEVVAKEEETFLHTIVTYLKEHKGEFLYIESDEFEEARIESLSIEVDDVFGNYMALFGFRAQKKMGESIQQYLKENLIGEEIRFSVMFSNEDGLWEMNIPIDSIEGFDEGMSIKDAIALTKSFIENMVQSIS